MVSLDKMLQMTFFGLPPILMTIIRIVFLRWL